MTTFACTYQELRNLAGEYIKEIPTCTLEELEKGLACVQLHYLGLTSKVEHELAGADALLRIVSKLYIEREVQLNPFLETLNVSSKT